MVSSSGMEGDNDNEGSSGNPIVGTSGEESAGTPVGDIAGSEGSSSPGNSITPLIIINELLCYVQYHMKRTPKENILDVLNSFYGEE